MLQTFTYWTGWAFTGRSAAWPAVTATRPAAEPRRTLLTIFISTSNFRQLITVGGFHSPLGARTPGKVPLAPNPRPRSLLTPWGTLRQPHQATVADRLNAVDGKAHERWNRQRLECVAAAHGRCLQPVRIGNYL